MINRRCTTEAAHHARMRPNGTSCNTVSTPPMPRVFGAAVNVIRGSTYCAPPASGDKFPPVAITKGDV
jgi:hypothetical protein